MVQPMRIRLTATVFASLALVATACGDDEAPGATVVSTTAVPTTSAAAPTVDSPALDAFRTQVPACGGRRPALPSALGFEAPADVGVSGEVVLTLETSCGIITLSLDPSIAPIAVNSFVFLAEQGYFDRTVFHRVVPGFVIQGGDPTATGRGGPGYRLSDELPAAGFLYSRGTVAMANSGPDSAGSQFFLVLDDVGLSPSFTVFGSVIGGLDVLDLIAAVPMGPNSGDSVPSRPLETIYLERVDLGS